MDVIPPEWLTGASGGVGGLMTLAYLMLATGRLYTKNVVDEKNTEIRENRETIRELLDQNGTLIRENEASLKALDAMREAAQSAGGTS